MLVGLFFIYIFGGVLYDGHVLIEQHRLWSHLRKMKVCDYIITSVVRTINVGWPVSE